MGLQFKPTFGRRASPPCPSKTDREGYLPLRARAQMAGWLSFVTYSRQFRDLDIAG